jgi:hypothetical protein
VSKQPIDEKMMVDYLLGRLPESETERLDELSIADDEFAEKLRSVENDLVDSYVRGELSGNVLDNFKSHYMQSSRRREKLAFAETFVNTIDNSKSALPEESTVRTYRRKVFFTTPAFQWGFAAAALVILLLSGYLIFENFRLRNEIELARTNQESLKQREQELQRKLAEQHSSDIATKNELERVRQKLAELEQQLGPTEQPKLLAFNLSPQTRGIGKIPVINVPKETEYILMNLDLELNDFSLYEAILKDPATNGVLWRSDKLKANSANKLQIRLPLSLLKTQNYFVDVSGNSGEIVSSYPFKLVMQ